MTQFKFQTPIDIHNFRDVNVASAELAYPDPSCAPGKYLVEYADGDIAGYDTEDTACAVQRAWRLAHGRHPLTAAPLVEVLTLVIGLAVEAVGVRQTGGDPEDTAEVLALHRDTIDQGEALIRALKEH